MNKNEVLKILETAKDKNGEVPMRLVRQAFEKLPEPCEDDPRADVYYLAEKIGIHQLYALVVQLRGEPEPCEVDHSKYEYHYDHTDCIWYRPEARNRCPSTCAQYRDGWNDAMNYIFRDGKGYRPYRMGERYEDD